MTQEINNERNVSIDILRILLALMVVTIHIGAPATGHVIGSISWMPMKLFANIAHYSSIPAVNIYILISGYFSYKTNSDYRRILGKALSLWLVLLFYSLAGFLVSCVFYNNDFSQGELVNRFFLLSTGEWWFMTNYFCLIFIAPLLNIIITSFTNRDYYIFVIMVAVICMVLPSLCGWKDAIGINYGYSLIWFIVLYIVGGGIKRFALDKKYNWGFRKYILCYFIMTLLILVQNMFFGKVLHLSEYAFNHYNSLTIFIQAVFLFLAFLNLKISCRFNRMIIVLSSLSMSVYIFHCQTDFSKILWNETTPSNYANEVILPCVYIAITIGVFVIACSIEYFRVIAYRILTIDKISSLLMIPIGRLLSKLEKFN